MGTDLPRAIFEKEPGSKIYWIRYTDAEGNRRREKCGNLTAAKKRLDVRRAEKHEGRQPDKPRSGALFGELLDDAVAYAKAENATARDLEWKLNSIRPDFGSIPASKITQAHILEWLEAQADERGWTSASRNRYQAAWSLVFRIAIKNKKAKENPASGIKHKREDNQRTRYLSPSEEVLLSRAIEERFPPYVPVFQLALHTGMRASELLRAKVGDYSPNTGMMAIRQQKVRKASTFRYVPTTPIAIAAYNRLAHGKQAGEQLCSKMEARNGPDLNSMRYWFEPCVSEAGLVDFLWHDLRHTFASRLVMGGMPLAAVAQYMGHQSITMTMRYSHLSPNTHSQANEIMMGFYPQNGRSTERSTGTIGLVSMQDK